MINLDTIVLKSKGVFLVDYCRDNDEGKEIVERVEFYDDRYILQYEEEWNMPYILSVDRKGQV